MPLGDWGDVWVCMGGFIPWDQTGGRMSQVDRVAGSLNTSKSHTHTHTHERRNIPVGATRRPPLIVSPDGATPVKNRREKRAKTQRGVFEVRWEHRKKSDKKEVRWSQRNIKLNTEVQKPFSFLGEKKKDRQNINKKKDTKEVLTSAWQHLCHRLGWWCWAQSSCCMFAGSRWWSAPGLHAHKPETPCKLEKRQCTWLNGSCQHEAC